MGNAFESMVRATGESKQGARADLVRRVARVGLSLAVLLFAGCGPLLYTSEVDSAETVVAQAREHNARWYAPYEYYYAEAHLEKAREEAASSDYEDAIRFAKVATEYGTRALRIAERQQSEER